MPDFAALSLPALVGLFAAGAGLVWYAGTPTAWPHWQNLMASTIPVRLRRLSRPGGLFVDKVMRFVVWLA